MANRDKRGRFVKGHSGNPKGAPKTGQRITDIIREIGATKRKVRVDGKNEEMELLRLAVLKMFDEALKGSVPAMVWIANYRDGRPVNEIKGEIAFGDLIKCKELEDATNPEV